MKVDNILFVAHRRELLKQMKCVADGLSVTYSTVQSVHKYLNKNYDLIIIDEAHHSACKSYQQLFGESKILGLTATPQRLDGKPLNLQFEIIIETPGVEELQAQGYLVQAVERTIKNKLNLNEIKKTAADYNVKDMSVKVRSIIILSDILLEYKNHALNRKTLIYCIDIAHCKDVCELFKGAGYNAEFISGKTKLCDRERILSDFKADRVDVLVNCMLFVEGLDVPGVECIIMLRPTMSATLYRQMVGRGLRPNGAKKDCLIIDHVQNYHTHGSANNNPLWNYDTRERLIGGNSNFNPNPSTITQILELKNYALTQISPVGFAGVV